MGLIEEQNISPIIKKGKDKMEKNNTGKKVMIGILIGVAIIVAIVIGMMSKKSTNQKVETQNTTNAVVEETNQDLPSEEPNKQQPEEEKQVGI